MTSAKHKVPWSKSKFPANKIARFLLDASKGDLNSEWKAYGKLFSQLVTARSIELASVDKPIVNFAAHLRENDAEKNKLYLSGLFRSLQIKDLSPKFTLSALTDFTAELIEELNREQLIQLNHQRKKKRQHQIKRDTPLPDSDNIPPQRISFKGRKSKYANRINGGQIAEYLFAVCRNKKCSFSREAKKQFSQLIVSLQMQHGTITEAPSLTSLTAGLKHNQRTLKSIFASIGVKIDPANLSITDFLKIVSRMIDEVMNVPQKRKNTRR